MSRYRLVLLLAFFLIYGCENDSGGTSLPPVTSVTSGGAAAAAVDHIHITDSTGSSTGVTISSGETEQFTAEGHNASDTLLTGVAFTWQSSNSAVATITTSSGLATAVSPGTTTITATANGKTSNAVTLTIDCNSTPDNISGMTATPSSMSTLGTSSITVTIADCDTATTPDIPDGTVVTFSVTPDTIGTVTPQATTVGGVATATFTAGLSAGIATVTATAGTVSNSIPVTILAPDVGSIEFGSATPQVIGVKGGGQTESSSVVFLVKDVNGVLAPDGTKVIFKLVGPQGTSTSTPSNLNQEALTFYSVSTSDGNANTTLLSGTVAGPVQIIACVDGNSNSICDAGEISSSSGPLSIGGGVPSATHFNIATTQFNLPGLVLSNEEAILSAFIADRFGNFNILTGTSVSFYAEAGAIDRSNVTDDTGITSVSFRTQAPDPEEVAIRADETSLITSLNTAYSLTIPTDGSFHPRDGWLKVLATVQGEETFDDANANGVYDTGESFDDLGEPFIDKDDDGARDTTPFEEYIDSNGNGAYDGPNGAWDGSGCTGTGCQSSKMIWTAITLAFTGEAVYCAITSPEPIPFTILGGVGDSQTFTFMVGDENTNMLHPGTTITVTTTAGVLSGQTDITIPDGVPFGPKEITFTIGKDPISTTANETALVTVTVNSSKVVGCDLSVSGVIE